MVRRVVGPALAQRLDAGLDDHPRRVEVRLADPEADDVVHGGHDVEEAADPRWRYRVDTLRQHALGQGQAGDRLGLARRHRAARARMRSIGVGVDGSSSAARSVGSSVRQAAPDVIPS